MLSEWKEPRINEDIQLILHLSDLAKTGDWYLYLDHTKIRVYKCELAPLQAAQAPTYQDIRSGIYPKDDKLRQCSLRVIQKETTIED
jgi:hypothetical protein